MFYLSLSLSLSLYLSFQEYLTNAQLWAGVGVMQMFQSFLPAGEIFNPILDDVLDAMAFVQVQTLKEIQLNSQTTGLVNYMRETAGYDGPISITGHSLGGGIALITGAQTNIPAIAISGKALMNYIDCANYQHLSHQQIV